MSGGVADKVPSETTAPPAEQQAEQILPARSPKKRMLVIVNPYATTVSDRLKNLVVYALQARYEVEAVDTERRDHATQICREAASEGYDAVVAFGGDGTVNEAANGLVGSDTPLTCLPGGSTNVWCRTLGIPNDVVDATEHLLRLADDFHPRKVDLGKVGARHFVFSAGVGLDASVVERVDAKPRVKARLGEYYYTYAAISTFNRRYLVRPPHVRVEAQGRSIAGVTAIVQNSDQYTYFGRRPIRINEGTALDNGTLGITVLTRATVLEIPTVIARVFSGKAATVARHRRIEAFRDVTEATITSTDDRPFPVQVDGDYIGNFEELSLSVAPRALTVVS